MTETDGAAQPRVTETIRIDIFNRVQLETALYVFRLSCSNVVLWGSFPSSDFCSLAKPQHRHSRRDLGTIELVIIMVRCLNVRVPRTLWLFFRTLLTITLQLQGACAHGVTWQLGARARAT